MSDHGTLKDLFEAGLNAGQEALSLGDEPPQLDGYEVEARLGRGGMGEVYLARNIRLERPVALKVLRGAPESLEAERMAREGKVLARLSHPHIIGVHDFLVDGVGRPCLVLELVRGGDLAARLTREGLPIATALSWFRDIVTAVGYAHAHGVLHRDLKPANILFDEAGRVKVGDFGLAALEETESSLTLTLSGTTAGTEAYMSPEQKNGEPLDARSDLYSLGVLLYEMITGRRPQGIFSPLKDKHLDRVVRRCLREHPDDRYPDCEALLADLQKPKQKLWMGAAAAGLGFVAVLAVAGFRSGLMEEPVPPSSERRAAATPSIDEREVPPVETGVLPPEPMAEAEVDLLAQLRAEFGDVRRMGTWTIDGEALVTRQGTDSRAWIELPHNLGTAYDLEVTATRLTGQDSMPIVFPTAAGVVHLEMDAWRQGLGGFQNVDGQDLRQADTSFPFQYRNGVPTTVLLRVRPDQVSVFVDGRLRKSLALADRVLSKPPIWGMPDDLRLGVGVWEADARFDRIVVRPVPME